MTGKYENEDKIQRRINIDVDIKDEDMNGISQDDYCLCKNRLITFTWELNKDN